MESTVKIYSLGITEQKTYLYTLLFVLGNIILPQMCHLIPQGGLIFLPIYFFTLIGAYKYGLKVGLMTAILSPIANSMLFGMPAASIVPIIIMKSSVLAIFASLIAQKFQKVSLPLLVMTVLGYQIVCTLAESLIAGSLYVGMQDFRLGVPGILLQIFGGFAALRYLMKD